MFVNFPLWQTEFLPRGGVSPGAPYLLSPGSSPGGSPIGGYNPAVRGLLNSDIPGETANKVENYAFERFIPTSIPSRGGASPGAPCLPSPGSSPGGSPIEGDGPVGGGLLNSADLSGKTTDKVKNFAFEKSIPNSTKGATRERNALLGKCTQGYLVWRLGKKGSPDDPVQGQDGNFYRFPAKDLDSTKRRWDHIWSDWKRALHDYDVEPSEEDVAKAIFLKCEDLSNLDLVVKEGKENVKRLKELLSQGDPKFKRSIDHSNGQVQKFEEILSELSRRLEGAALSRRLEGAARVEELLSKLPPREVKGLLSELRPIEND